ncbi:hypothetical protein [Maledivibacter halophilus]|uniref:hypothetical protein n=1 Tax=Maledivibacter halophilus TaxID=36842 RepID=UPI0009A766AA|nr:hypothetical protein [Maledivibacter halophilus]
MGDNTQKQKFKKPYKKLHFIGYEKIYDLTYRVWKLQGKNPLKTDKNFIQNKVELMTYDDIDTPRRIDYYLLP